MKTETILALAGISATAVVSMTGIIATATTAGRGRQAAKDLADTARTQQRLADAYIDVLTFVETVGTWSQLVRPALDRELNVALPDQDSEVLAKAKLAAYGSAEVKNLFGVWRECVLKIQQADARIGRRIAKAEEHKHLPMREGQNESWRDPLPPWEELEDTLRPAERVARADLVERISSELL